MKFKNYSNLMSFIVLLIVIASCNKVVNTTATITVVDEKAKLISGATVHVFPSPGDSISADSVSLNEDLDETKVTDNKGQVFFDYTEFYKRGQTGLFVLDMEVSYSGPDSVVTVNTVIKIEEQIENQKTVVLPIIL